MSTLDSLPGSDLIGCGYDVLNGYYADSRSCNEGLFNFTNDSITVLVGDKKRFTVSKDIIYHSSISTKLNVQWGRTIKEYISSVNSKTKVEGKYNFFSGSIEVDIGMDKASDSENAFSKVAYNTNLFTLQLPARHSQMLKSSVKEDIDSMADLTLLFDTYGTHYVSELVMGGVANYTASTNKDSFSSKTDIGIAARMSYKELVGSITAEEKLEYKEAIKTFNESSSITLVTTGGDPALGGDDFPKHVTEWGSSVINFMAMVDFLGSRSLLGIWDLASTKARKEKIHNHYAAYCKLKEVQYVETPPFIRVKVVPLAKQQFTDIGSGAKKDLAVWKPDVGDRWYYFGQNAFATHGDVKANGLVVQEVHEGSAVLVDVDHWERVWDDHGSGKQGNYSLWRGVAANPVDYIVLGDFFRGGVGDQNPPTREETAKIKAVRRDCLVSVASDHFVEVWNDAGTGANDDGSIWLAARMIQPNVPPPTDALDLPVAPYYVSTKSHQKPSRDAYLLKASTAAVSS